MIRSLASTVSAGNNWIPNEGGCECGYLPRVAREGVSV